MRAHKVLPGTELNSGASGLQVGGSISTPVPPFIPIKTLIYSFPSLDEQKSYRNIRLKSEKKVVLSRLVTICTK